MNRSTYAPTYYNLTPYPFRLPIDEEFDEYTGIFPSGKVAECVFTHEYAGVIDNNKITRELLEIKNLPKPKKGTLFIVSEEVRRACRERKDIFSPSYFERDNEGAIIACYDLVSN
jgi:hypothetical protein